jgi:hypothetical protein
MPNRLVGRGETLQEIVFDLGHKHQCVFIWPRGHFPNFHSNSVCLIKGGLDLNKIDS